MPNVSSSSSSWSINAASSSIDYDINLGISGIYSSKSDGKLSKLSNSDPLGDLLFSRTRDSYTRGAIYYSSYSRP